MATSEDTATEDAFGDDECGEEVKDETSVEDVAENRVEGEAPSIDEGDKDATAPSSRPTPVSLKAFEDTRIDAEDLCEPKLETLEALGGVEGVLGD